MGPQQGYIGCASVGTLSVISGMAPSLLALIATAIISPCTLMMIPHVKHSFGGALTIRAAILTSNSVLGMKMFAENDTVLLLELKLMVLA